MRVLHVISGIDPKSGGPLSVLAGLADAQRRAGVNVSILATYGEGEDVSLAGVWQRNGIPVMLVGPCRGRLRNCPGLSVAARAAVNEAHIVHIHALWEEVQHQAARWARETSKPYIISPHGMLDPWSLAQSRLKKRLYLAWRLRKLLADAPALHFTTSTEREMAARAGFHAPAIVEPVGVDLSEFRDLPQRGSFRRQHPRLMDKPLIAFMGRIHPGKGLEYLVPALGKIANKNAMLAIIGPDSRHYRATIERRVEELGLMDRVLFTGMLRGADRIAALADADLFALPSDHENFGIAIVEALAAGTPALISDQVQIKDQIIAGGVGEAVHNDVDSVVAGLDRWLGDDALRQAAAAKARPFVWEHYDWQRVGARWVDHYRRLLNASGDVDHGALSPTAMPMVQTPTATSTAFGAGRDDRPPPRVLHAISSISPESGGPAVAMIGLLRAQAEAGMKVSLLATWDGRYPQKTIEHLQSIGVELTVIGPTRGVLSRHPRLAGECAALVARHDIVHVHALWEDIQHQVMTAARAGGVPYVMRPSGMLDPWSLGQHRLRKRVYLRWRLMDHLRGAAAIHCTSQTEANMVALLQGVAPTLIEPNGVDLSEFQRLPPKGGFRAKYGLDDRLVVLFLGRIHPGKGLEYLVPAMAALDRSTRLVIAGPDSGGYRAKIQALAARHGVTDRIVFTGMVYGPQRVAALLDADLFALPSDHENFGVAVIEALAAGTPVVISDQVYIHQELREAGVAGVVPTQVEPLALELRRWLENPGLRRETSARARTFVQERYDWRKIARRWREHYHRLIEAARASGSAHDGAISAPPDSLTLIQEQEA